MLPSGLGEPWLNSWLFQAAAKAERSPRDAAMVLAEAAFVSYRETTGAQRAAFLDHHFWATRFRDAEMHASGYYPNQSKGGDGLEKWTADDESLLKQERKALHSLVGHALEELYPDREVWPLDESIPAEVEMKAIIDRFGHFPHRNAILGRQSTAEEAEFLKQPGSGF